MKISSLLHQENKWCQNAIACDKEGKPLKDINTFYLQRIDKKGNIFFQEFRNEDLAYSFSLYGAVIKAYDVEDRGFVMEKLSAAIQRYTNKDYWVAQYNDLPETTFNDIKTIIEMADV